MYDFIITIIIVIIATIFIGVTIYKRYFGTKDVEICSGCAIEKSCKQKKHDLASECKVNDSKENKK